MTHLDEEVLGTYSLDPKAVGNRDVVEAHLAACESCREELARYQRLDSALSHHETREAAQQIVSPTLRLEEFRAARLQTEREEEEARKILAPLLKSPLKFRNADLAAKPRCQTAGMVRVLCAEAHTRHEQRPRFTESVAATAYAIAAKLDNVPESEKRTLMGIALREGANALRYLGKFAEALQLLDRAERLFDSSPAADAFDRAIVWHIRATIYMKSDRLSDGISLERNAAKLFREYGDRRRELSSSLVEASCLLLSGEATAAAEAFERVIVLARDSADSRVLAGALNNAGMARVAARELERAERYYVEALALFDELDMPTEKARTTWALASLVVARGDLVDGLRRLEASRAELAALGLTNDAALATLHWAEVRLALGQSEGVAEACRKIIVVFAHEGMQRHARQALAMLTEALAAGRATPALVRDVRTYIEQLPANPAQPFVAHH